MFKGFHFVGWFDIYISFLQSLIIEISENNPMSQVVLIPSSKNVENCKVCFNLK